MSISRLWRLSLWALLVTAPAWAQERELHWREIAVKARLDAEGRLHVTERQTMMFTGDWNGGERRFDVGLGQHLDFHRISRVDPRTGALVPLRENEDLSEVDDWAWAEDQSDTVRWRSRLPSDPSFAGTEIIYVLEFSYSDILFKDRGLYYLDHDFAFADRTGDIERFTLDLELDPAWRPAGPLPSRLERTNIPPGYGVVQRASLEHRGAEAPQVVRTMTPLGLRYAFFLGTVLAMAWLYTVFQQRERELGRFVPVPVPERPDPQWLQEYLFRYRPEEIGALWDRKVGSAEVAATLARLVAEGKLESEVVPRTWWLGRDVLRLRRIASPHAFADYDSELVSKLFFDGRDEVDTDEIRRHYKSRGFDPAGLIREKLEKRLEKRPELKGKTKPPSFRRTLFLALATVALFVLDLFLEWQQGLVVGVIALFGFFWLCLFGILGAISWRHRVESLGRGSLRFLLPAFALVLYCALLVFYPEWFYEAGRLLLRPGLFGCLALALAPVAAFSSLLNQAASRETPEVIRRRRELAGIRRWLADELRRPEPALRDEWFPYLLAFGLQSEVDRWFSAFGGAGRTSPGLAGSSSSSASFGGSGSGGWTGGGGAFGGAGATSSWAAAATGIAAGVSSSSSSGGGGGGGGGSGGGGGGGW
ncbi:MAG TPA: hypothetical protein VF756_23455 [Thermoanaerobaculia bacterium]